MKYFLIIAQFIFLPIFICACDPPSETPLCGSVFYLDKPASADSAYILISNGISVIFEETISEYALFNVPLEKMDSLNYKYWKLDITVYCNSKRVSIPAYQIDFERNKTMMYDVGDMDDATAYFFSKDSVCGDLGSYGIRISEDNVCK